MMTAMRQRAGRAERQLRRMAHGQPRVAAQRTLAWWQTTCRDKGWRDARLFQIVFLATLLTVGVLLRDFTLDARQMALGFGAALATQWLWLRALRLEHRGQLSALVTALGLCLLLRADSLWVHPLAAALAISSKFVLRLHGRHVFNPANLGVIAASSLLPGAWISPGQWGEGIVLAGWLVVLGSVVTARARRSDMAWSFLGVYAVMQACRVLWLGQPASVLVHQLATGGLLLFAFFMISDPMTTPTYPWARFAYAVVVAATAYAWQFVLFRPNALLWALLLATPLVPLFNRAWPGPGFSWRA